jgi:hypothetical protein
VCPFLFQFAFRDLFLDFDVRFLGTAIIYYLKLSFICDTDDILDFLKSQI